MGSRGPKVQVEKGERRLLIVAPFPPDLSGDHGGSRAIAALVEMLARKHSVTVVYLREADGEEIRRTPSGCHRITGVPRRVAPPSRAPHLASRILEAAGLLAGSEPAWVRESWSPEMAEAVAAAARDLVPDFVHFEFHVMAQYVPYVRAEAPRARCIVTEHEPGVVAAGEHIGGFRQRLGSFVRKFAWTRFERAALAQADAVVTFTQKDRKAVQEVVGSSPMVTCIPLRILPPTGAERPAHKSELLFVGSFRHPPNADAALRLVKSIFPKVREALPATRMCIVGADPPQELIDAAGDGVEVTGRVENVEPYLAGASLFMCPLRLGGGMRVKVLEACAFGKPVIASPQAVEGLGLRPATDYVSAESDDEFVRGAIELLSNPERCDQLGRSARQWFDRTQNLEDWADEYDALYQQLISKKPR